MADQGQTERKHNTSAINATQLEGGHPQAAQLTERERNRKLLTGRGRNRQPLNIILLFLGLPITRKKKQNNRAINFLEWNYGRGLNVKRVIENERLPS